MYCSDTAQLAFARREHILGNLCHYFNSARDTVVVVIDEADPHRKELELLIAQLVTGGQKLRIEYKSAEAHEQFEKQWHLRWLKAGKKFSSN